MLRQMDMKFCADRRSGWFYLPYRHWAIMAHVVEDGIMFQVPYLARH
ncbi:MAG: hypothetical protein M5U09_22290 [Gammaproteobacteria bacterium]|nr:hypothetical protein [Gammaproteobacteria bacterium]